MADGARYEVVNGKKIRRQLKEAGEDLSDLKAAHREAARIAAEASADLAPVGKTGRLRKTIRASGTNTAGIIRAGNNTRVPYAAPIHWGWHRRHIKPQPFLSDGATSSENRWVPVYEVALDGAIKRIGD